MKQLHDQYIELVRSGPNGLFSKGDLARLEAHVADGITGAAILRELGASSVVDAGSGGGVPGIPVAVELPHAIVHLVESQGWKADFLRTCAHALDLESRLSVHALRAEEAPAAIGRELLDVGIARALASPLVVAEYLSPLIRVGGHLALWSTVEQAADPLVAGSEILGLAEPRVEPAPSELRADGVVIVWPKVAPCADRVPRRVGVAARRPLR
ncbi:MAG: rRNA ((527)-N(7))-methyltransferase RsmG [Thermoleophilia bacterium]|nr:rRNA ((527)-N(7))-methyltransferase RsmG [Thermoleophilia bacterium]